MYRSLPPNPLKLEISVLWIFRCANPPTKNLMSSLHRNNIVVNSVTKIVDLAARVDCFVIKSIAFSFKWLNWYNRICRQLSQMRPPSKIKIFNLSAMGGFARDYGMYDFFQRTSFKSSIQKLAQSFFNFSSLSGLRKNFQFHLLSKIFTVDKWRSADSITEIWSYGHP